MMEWLVGWLFVCVICMVAGKSYIKVITIADKLMHRPHGGHTEYKIKCQTISRLQLTVACIQFTQVILYPRQHHHHQQQHLHRL